MDENKRVDDVQKKVAEFAVKLSDLCREYGFGLAGEPTVFVMEPADLNHSYVVDDDGRLVFY